MEEAIGVSCIWTVKERDEQTGLYLPVLSRKNTFTLTGLSALASAISGNYVAPQYLAIENNGSLIQNGAGLSVGATSVTLDGNPMEATDTGLILSVGLAHQETVTVSHVSGGGPYVFTISATTKTHALDDPCCRLPRTIDAVSNLQNEWQYDATNAPNQRAFSSAGYTTGAGVWVAQFYFNGSQAVGNFTTLGLCDSQLLGTGNLHNHVALGYVHVVGNDLEIDGTLTLVNN